MRANAPHDPKIVVRCGKSKNFRLCVHEYVYSGFPKASKAVIDEAAERRLRLLISLIEREFFCASSARRCHGRNQEIRPSLLVIEVDSAAGRLREPACRRSGPTATSRSPNQTDSER